MDAKSISRIVVVDEGERSRISSDAQPADVLTDPARPGSPRHEYGRPTVPGAAEERA